MAKARVDRFSTRCWHRLALRLVCALALICVGLSHRVPVLAGESLQAASSILIAPAERFAYLLPDGSLPQLCHETAASAAGPADAGHEQDGRHGPWHNSARCDACRLCAAILLPPPPDLIGQRLRPALAAPLPAMTALPEIRRIPRESQPRAPPVLPA
ncbi:hypothetical protein BJF92_08145 [Rhizobium rhizosphaerae]|uniref:DUF2946 domain-containing protein n=1 Tax=Xaviernesmea rhizosphaerae TaxID=1672749 RepID=A0A1Q9AK30_9HYPH|nr:DUF2946 family protein [Xaviernesmea rhizosphaerae]OLP55635.1 hypothetical protein BJF92_08145 [Xaviernesmea rhizosphaerae]